MLKIIPLLLVACNLQAQQALPQTPADNIQPIPGSKQLEQQNAMLQKQAGLEHLSPQEFAVYQRVQQIKPQNGGTVNLSEAQAELVLPPGYLFLSKSDARFVLEDLFKNRKDTNTIGLIFHQDSDILQDSNASFVVVSYDACGHIRDSDAAQLDDHEALLESYRASGKDRIGNVTWQNTPKYDANGKKLAWAIQFTDLQDPVKRALVNNEIRILGRHGFVSLLCVHRPEKSAEAAAFMPQLATATNFRQGAAYGDFREGVDNVASYGLAALVSGGVLAKSGMFAKLLIAFKSSFKLIIAGIVAAFYLLRKILGGKKKSQQNPS